MSEQTIQNELYSNQVLIEDKYICLNLGATTINNLLKIKFLKNIPVSKKNKSKKPDVLIINKNKETIIYQEQKIPTKFKSEKDIQNAINQEIDVAIELGAKIFIVSDGESFIWINPKTKNKIKDANGNFINQQLKPKDNPKELLKLIQDITESINDSNDCILKKVYLDPTDLAIKINSVLKNLTFASSKMALYTFVEVFLFKYLSDIGILKGENSFEYIYSLYGEKEDDKKPKYDNATILGKYTDGAREQMKYLFPIGKDGTTIINGKIFHVEKQGAEYISPDNTDLVFKEVIQEFKNYEKENGYFKYISKDFKSKLFETFMKNSDDKADMGQFFTPLKIVKNMVKMIDIKPGMKICDPSCGVGKFLLEIVENQIDELYKFNNNKLNCGITLTGYEKMMSEKDDITIILAKANMLIYFSKIFQDNKEDISTIANELMNSTFTLYKTLLGTLDKIDEDTYDLIVGNPPYYQSKIITKAARDLELYSLGGLGVEALFLEWILKSLKPGGVANVVLPDGIFSNVSNEKLKGYMINNCFIESIISLPINTFFNTPKKTYILTIKRKTENEIKENIVQSYPVFTYICKSIGETLDSYRFDIDDNDLDKAVEKYNHFKNMNTSDKNELKEPFKTFFEEDKQFKAIDINELKPEKSWIIENWWTKEEKIEIGLIKEVNIVSIEEFETILDDTINLLTDFKEALECMNEKE